MSQFQRLCALFQCVGVINLTPLQHRALYILLLLGLDKQVGIYYEKYVLGHILKKNEICSVLMIVHYDDMIKRNDFFLEIVYMKWFEDFQID